MRGFRGLSREFTKTLRWAFFLVILVTPFAFTLHIESWTAFKTECSSKEFRNQNGKAFVLLIYILCGKHNDRLSRGSPFPEFKLFASGLVTHNTYVTFSKTVHPSINIPELLLKMTTNVYFRPFLSLLEGFSIFSSDAFGSSPVRSFFLRISEKIFLKQSSVKISKL